MKRTLFALSALYVLTLIAFAWLYLFTPPREVVREIIRERTPEPVEKLVQPVEKMVQDTLRPLMPAESSAVKTLDWEALPHSTSETEILRAIGPVRVQVTLNEILAKSVEATKAEEAVRTALGRKDIPVAEDAGSTLAVNIHGLWDDAEQVLIYRIAVSLTENTVLRRPAGLIRVPSDIWQRGSYGFAARSTSADTVVTEAARLSAIFADCYLAANPPVSAALAQP